MAFKQTSIYIFYDDSGVFDIIRTLVNSIFDNVTPINIKTEQGKFIKALSGHHTAMLFIYAFDRAEDAERLASLLHRHDALRSYDHIPRFDVLLCDKANRLAAYSLCERNQFYTYETIKPIYDTNRVKLTLKRLAEHLQADAELLKVGTENAELSGTLAESVDSINKLQQDVESEAEEKAKELAEIASPLDKMLQNIPVAEWERVLSSILKSLPEPVQRETSKIFSLEVFRDNLETFKDSTVGSLQAFSSMLDTIKPKIKHERPVVVVADDQPVMLKIIASILEPRGYKVELASNGVEAIMKAKVMVPKVMLLDIDMPIMGGIEALQAMKKIDALKRVPVIMITSHADKVIIKSCIENGAADYMVKPTRADLLLKKIAKALS